MKDALIEAGKELLRVVLLAVVPLLVFGLESGQVDLKVVWTAAGVAALRAIDKFLHEWGKEVKSDVLEGGITRF